MRRGIQILPSAIADHSLVAQPTVRGLYGEEMDAETAHLIGRAFAHVLARLRDKETNDLVVGLGRDMRLTAPEMAGEVRRGLVDEGVRVIDAGQVATEMLYFLVGSRGLDGGAMVTASHNPRAYNGMKIVRRGARPVGGDTGLDKIKRFAEEGTPDGPGQPGTISQRDIYEGFHERVLRFIGK